MRFENRVRLIEHTADMGIEAWGTNRKNVLAEMARGLTLLMFGTSHADAIISTEILVPKQEPENLLVCWLNEIVYWSERDNLVPATFQVDFNRDGDLLAKVSGEPFNPSRHNAERQVKAVTYHQACLNEDSYGWHAKVYVDL